MGAVPQTRATDVCRLRRMTHRNGGEAGTAGTRRATPGRVHGASGDEARKDGTGTGVK